MGKRLEALGLGVLATVVPLAIGYAVSGPPEIVGAAPISRRQRRVTRAPAAVGEGVVCIYPVTPTGGRMTSPISDIPIHGAIERLACPLGGGRVVTKSQARALGYMVR